VTRELSAIQQRVLAESADAPESPPDKGMGASSLAGCDNTRRDRGRYAAAILLAGAVSLLAEDAWARGPAGDAARGETLYEACQDCHSLDKNDVGPRHRGVFGRKAGSLPDYDYSDALKSANIVWNEETLDKWLTDPQAVAPGAKMFFHLDNPQDRADVIAYLKERAR
jgi:cytochrome c